MFTRSSVASVVLLPALLVAQTPAASQEADRVLPAGHKMPVSSVTAVRRTGAIRLDAVLDEEGWKVGRPITDFTQFDPDEGKPASQRTEVRFL